MKFWYRNVDRMPLWTPSREGDKQPAIDGLLAQHVLGWKEITLSPYGHYYGRPDDSNYGDHRDYDQVPALSETWEGLGLVVEAMRKKHDAWVIVKQWFKTEKWSVGFFGRDKIGNGDADTAPMAAARAALDYLNVEVAS